MMLKTFVYLQITLYLCVCLAELNSNEPIVTIQQGRIRGIQDTLYDGSTYYSFMGIPYAQPPIGQLRFRAPLPPTPWKGIYNATKPGSVCSQKDLYDNAPYLGDEDCLFLNVYTKSLQSTSKIPVMVFIHGGSYMTGSSTEFYGPKFLLQHDVILVTVNYRLEVLGFLSLDIPEVPGNAGMKDQVTALRWVRKNIDKFGGDPNKVTLFGESSGATAVTYHMISPMSRGLFHKAIAQSGTCLSDWAQGKDGKVRAFRAGRYLGKNTKNTTELLQFLRSLPAENLTKLNLVTATDEEINRGIYFNYVPVVEKRFKNVEAFLTEVPQDIILSRRMIKIPFMIGYNSAEGTTIVVERLKRLEFYNRNPYYDVPREVAQRISNKTMLKMGDRIKKFYIGDRDFTSDDLQQLNELLADTNFIYNTHRFLNFYSKYNNPIYMYKFSLVTDLNYIRNLFGLNIEGASHADDLFYMFSTDYTKDAYEKQDRLKELVWRVTKMWTDFAKTSNPTPNNSVGIKWKPYTTSGKEYLNINDTMATGRFSEKERVTFWDKIYCEGGVPCIGL